MLNRTFEGHVLVMGSDGSRLALSPHVDHDAEGRDEHGHA